MAEKDFFDEEFDKTVKEQGQEQQKISFDSWYSRPAPEKADGKKSKPLYIVLTCFVLIACIGFGWLLCYVVNEITTPEEEKILRTVIEYLKNNYYEDVDNWTEAIEYSGSALMQKAGDRFSMLMSPQTYYDFLYDENVTNEVFGISFYIDDMGLYVSSVATNSSAYGKLQEGDYVLKLSDVKDKDGNTVVFEGQTFDELVISQWSSVTIRKVFDLAYSAKFHFLREDSSDESGVGYKILAKDLTRGAIPAVSGNKYGFIEYYFDETHTNISTTPLGDADISTYDERSIGQLQQISDKSGVKTGYIRITQFMYYVVNGAGGKIDQITASAEFLEVMELFHQLGLKRLVLDLKGNPGGNVAYVSDIAAMLVTSDKLSAAQKQSVTNKDGSLLMTYLEMPKPARIRDNYYRESSYYNYFDELGDVCDIVVWTDGGSASGSEMLTGVLLDYGTAVHMGTKTYGKGIAQTYAELPFTGKVKDLNNKVIDFPWAIYYTCAKYYSPLGVNIHEVGYVPTLYNNLSSYEALWAATGSYWA